MNEFKDVMYAAINENIDTIKFNHNFNAMIDDMNIPKDAGYKFVLENFIPRYAIKYNGFLVNRKIEELMTARRLISFLMKIDHNYIPDPEELYTTIAFMDMYMLESPLKHPHYSSHGYIKSKELLLNEFKPAIDDFIAHGANPRVVNTAITACSRVSLVEGTTREDKLGFYAMIVQILTVIKFHLNKSNYTKFISEEIKFYNEIDKDRSDWKIIDGFLGHWSLYLINSTINGHARLTRTHNKLTEAKRCLKEFRDVRYYGDK